MHGRVVGQRYQIGDRLGGGGMAVVYQARDLQLGRDVAVKVLRGQFGNDEDFVRRFRREASNAASLSHPNVVQIYDVGRDEDLYYIVLELVEGRTLKEVIQQQGPLPVVEASRIALEVLSALDHAHRHRIIHRDIKPHNILIARDGRVKVTDFGIARATTTDTVTHTGSIMGSAHYFSPEQANGQPTGEKSDLYSLGVVLYEMVTGSVPFQGDSPISVAIKHLREKVIPPSRLNAEIPVEMDEIILKALQKNPDDRYPSSSALRLALQDFVERHAAGLTHVASGDFPTMDLRSMKGLKLHRQIAQVQGGVEELEEPEERDEEEEALPTVRGRSARERLRGRERPRRSRGWLWVIVVALLVLGGIGAGAWAVIDLMEVPVVVVPDVTGMPQPEAEQTLKQARLGYRTESLQFHDTIPANAVIETKPAANSEVRENREILLVISKGPQVKPLPDVRGHMIEDARATLYNEGFVTGDVGRRIDPAEEGRVIEMNPPPGTHTKLGATINLVISSGPLRVPNVIGKKQDEARKMLADVGLSVAKIDMIIDPTKEKDTVISVSPPVGTSVAPASGITLMVAQGSNLGAGRSFEQQITVPGDKSKRYQLRVTLVDFIAGIPTESPRPLIDSQQQGGTQLSVSGVFYGDRAQLRVFVDNVEVQTIPLP